MITMAKLKKIASELKVPGRSYLTKDRLIEQVVNKDKHRKFGPRYLSDFLFSNLAKGDIVFLWNSDISGEVILKKKKGYDRFYKVQLKLLPCDVRRISYDFPTYKKNGNRYTIDVRQVFIEDRFFRNGKYYSQAGGSIKEC